MTEAKGKQNEKAGLVGTGKETISIICGSKKEFSKLKGDGSELLKITFGEEREYNELNGLWLYEKNNGKRIFLRQYQDKDSWQPIVEKISYKLKHLSFDKNLGIIPDLFDYDYSRIGKRNAKERDIQIQKLKERNLWKN